MVDLGVLRSNNRNRQNVLKVANHGQTDPKNQESQSRQTSSQQQGPQVEAESDQDLAVSQVLGSRHLPWNNRHGSKRGQVPLPERPAGCFAQRYLTPF